MKISLRQSRSRFTLGTLCMMQCILCAVPLCFSQESWQTIYAEKRAILTEHQNGAETLNLPPQSYLLLGKDIPPALLIEDLNITVDVKAPSAGVTLGVLVVLPRTQNPDTGQPLTYLIPGSKYSGSGQWETLGFFDKNGNNGLKKQADGIANRLRAELSRSEGNLSSPRLMDLNGKYVRQLVLFCESISEQTETKTVAMGVPKITGIVQGADAHRLPNIFPLTPLNLTAFQLEASVKPSFMARQFNEGTTGYTKWVSPLQPQNNGNRSDGSPQPVQFLRTALDYSSPASLMQIKLTSGILSVDDIPVGARVIEYNNEPLAMLRKLEFNAVWVKGTATPQLLQEARDTGVWLICTPPSPSELQRATRYTAPGSNEIPNGTEPLLGSTETLDSLYDNVLAWNLGDECAQVDHTVYAQWSNVLKNADRIRRRPIICTARSGVYDYSRIADILMMRREPLLSSLEMDKLRSWQMNYQTLARPDTTFWCNIQTQASENLQEQWAMFEGNPPYICPFFYEQIKLQVYNALATGVHGIVFSSNSPLTNNDPETEFRRTALELINWELQMIEDWFAAGRSAAELAKSNRKPMNSAVIQSGFSRLLVPVWNETQSQLALGPAVAGNLQYIIPGIPETYNAYHLVPGRLYPLEAQRVAGGMKIELPEANLNSLIFFGETNAVYAKVGQRAKMIGQRTAYLACRLAELELAATEQVLSALKQAKESGAMPIHPKDNLPLISVTEMETQLKSTKDAIHFAKELMQRHPPDFARAYLQAETATRGLRLISRDILQEATRNDLNPCMTPVSVSFSTMPLYVIAQKRTGGAKLESANRLLSGDLENLAAMNRAGWEIVSHKVEGVAPLIRNVIPAASRLPGKNGLQLAVVPKNSEERPAVLETVPAWLTTPPINVKMGEMICVHGWIRIPQPLQSTVDGLMVFDSLGGESLALRFLETKGEWKEFTFYRIAPSDGNYYVFFGLNGFGEVHLDDIRISSVQFPEPVAAPVVKPEQPPAALIQRLNPFQYLPPMPQWNEQ